MLKLNKILLNSEICLCNCNCPVIFQNFRVKASKWKNLKQNFHPGIELIKKESKISSELRKNAKPTSLSSLNIDEGLSFVKVDIREFGRISKILGI